VEERSDVVKKESEEEAKRGTTEHERVPRARVKRSSITARKNEGANWAVA